MENNSEMFGVGRGMGSEKEEGKEKRKKRNKTNFLSFLFYFFFLFYSFLKERLVIHWLNFSSLTGGAES